MIKPLSEDADLSQAERIDRACTAFEAAWKTGAAPRLEDWLHRVAAADRPALREELMLLDAHYRQRGETTGELSAVGCRPPAQGAPAAAPVPETVRYFGDYELLDEIGRGGMGVVYQGADTALNRKLAVKVLLNKHSDNEELKRRFLEEAQIMGQLQHPGVAPIHEIGALSDGRPFFSMKQIKGQTLIELLRGPPDLPRMLNIFEQVCQTVAAAHSRGIIHRDLKPGNVMVGAFGEVQVMDWGLAKVLNMPSGVPTSQAAQSPQATTLFVVRTGSRDDAETAVGTVLGTPAYMAPEQARGEIDQLDERCDVFGLGAVLCEILTGQAPFPGDTQHASHRKAMKSDLGETFTRLDDCGADPELVQLAKHCLAAAKKDRPRHAGAVAEAVTKYRAGVQERLRRAEIDRTSAQIKATEERRRRRVWVALAGMVMTFAVAASGAGIWYYYTRAEQVRQEVVQTSRKEQMERDLTNEMAAVEQQSKRLHQDLKDGKDASILLSDINKWRSLLEGARANWQRAKLLADSGKDLLEASWFARLKTLDQNIKADEEVWHWAKKLDDIRLRAATLVDGKWNPEIAAKEYPALFRELGLDVEKGDESQLAEQVKNSPIRYALVAALDHWARRPDTSKAGNKMFTSRLLALARHADPDPWRDQVRDEKVGEDPAKLFQLAKEAWPNKQTPQIMLLLASRLQNQNGKKEGIALLYRTLLHYPKDFWLHFELHYVVENPEEKVGCLRAALALRPDSAPAHVNLGLALQDKKDLDGAIRHFEKAVELDNNFAWAHHNLGNALRDMKDLDGALKHFHMAIGLDPSFANVHNGLGCVLLDQRDLDEAIETFHKAIELDPRFAFAHNNLGIALRDKKDLDGAIEHFRKAIELDPKFAGAHHNLGHALKNKNNLDEAIKHYHKAIELDPNSAFAHNNLGNALRMKKDLDGAIKHFYKTIELDPIFAFGHNNLGLALQDKNDLDGAIKHFHKAIELDPKFAGAHHDLGLALKNKNDLDGAIKHYQKAIELKPNYPDAHYHLGNALQVKKNLDGAIKHYQKAIELEPNSPKAHNNLGLVLQDKNNLDGAIVHYQKAIALDSNFAYAHNNLGLALQDKKDLDGAIKHFHIAIELDPSYPVAHYNLGLALVTKKDLDSAIAHYRKAIAVNPEYTWAHYVLGNALLNKKDLDGAIKHYHKVIELNPNFAEAQCNLGHALRQQGNFAQAMKFLQSGHELGMKQPRWTYASARWVNQCERLLELEQKLPAVLSGRVQPTDAAEQVELANLCLAYKKRYVTAAHFYAAALQAEPPLAGRHQYDAARAAVLAASAQGQDAGQLKDGEPAQLRRQALDWLKEELAELKKQLAAGPMPAARQTLQQWQSDPDLTSVRQAQELAKLSATERQEWEQFWVDVEAFVSSTKAGSSL